MITAILFDLDATLVDDGGNWRHSVNATIEEVCSRHSVPRDELRESYYEVAGQVWDEIRSVESSPWGNMDDKSIVQRVWRTALAQAGVQGTDTLSDCVELYLDLRRSAVPAFPDAEPCLQRLRSSFRLGVITNGYADQQEPKLASAGLQSYFQSVVTTDIGYGKPQREIFLHALDNLDVAADEAAYVGDSLSWDVLGANRAGLTSVWLNRAARKPKGEDPVPDMEIASLGELPDALLQGIGD